MRSNAVAEQLGGNNSAKEIQDFCGTKGWKDSVSLKQRVSKNVRADSNILNKNRLTKRDLESRDPEKTIQVFKCSCLFYLNVVFFIL